jgi:hypothetical protein
MTQDQDPAFENAEGYGIQDIEAPGEPNYWGHPVSDPVPGTKKGTRDEHLGLRGGHHETTEGSGHESGGGRDSH